MNLIRPLKFIWIKKKRGNELDKASQVYLDQKKERE